MFSIDKHTSIDILWINENDFEYHHKENNYEWYINGILFYLVDEKNKVIKGTDIDSKTLDSFFKKFKYKPNAIKHFLEGHYICIIKNEGKIIVFGDNFNRRDLFYYEDKDCVYFDTKLTRQLLEKCNQKLNTNYLYSFLQIGYGHATTTLFKDIHRLGYQEFAQFKDKRFCIQREFEPLPIEHYTDNKLKEFERLFIESLSNRIGDKGTTWLMASSGWDSTIILDNLLKVTDKKNVHTATFEVQFRNGQMLNNFEIQKIQEISDHYDVSNHRYLVDLNNKKLVEIWKDKIPLCFEHQVFQWPINQLGVIDYICKTDPNVTSIFNGECADSLQNFGFSQFTSIQSGINEFDEYADKMKTYLYGPSFYTEIKNGTFRENVIYKIFKKMNEHLFFNDEPNPSYLDVMLSFIYSPSRLPFTLSQHLPILDDNALTKFYSYAIQEYFKDHISLVTNENLYSIWVALYADFHFKGSTIPINIVGIEQAGKKAALPFFDMRLARFFAQMPESWGRGLNWNRLKYPEKMMAMNSKTYPTNIVDRKNTHSYIIEVDRNIDDNYEYYCNSSIGDYFREILSNPRSLDMFTTLKGINSDYINKIKTDFENKKPRSQDLSTIIRICTLISMVNEYLEKNTWMEKTV